MVILPALHRSTAAPPPLLPRWAAAVARRTAAAPLSWWRLRHSLPQPFEDIGHVADVGIRVRGGSPEEALARLALAFATLVTGGEEIAPFREERISVRGGPGLAGSAVSLMRELLFRLATARELPAEVEVLSVDERGAVADVLFGRHDPERHTEGADVKAVTWHAARLEPEGDGWVAQVVLDI
jgi:SHS2 domain-containing protein